MKLLLALLISLTTVLSSLAQSTHATATPAVRHEVRAAWLTTLFGLDWPQRPTMTTAGMAQQRRDLLRQLDELQAAGINTVLFLARIPQPTPLHLNLGTQHLPDKLDVLQTMIHCN